MTLVTDPRLSGIVRIEDFYPNGQPGVVQTKGTVPLGTMKTFDGTKEGKFVPGKLRLNPVTISTVTWKSPDDAVQTPNHPAWGMRRWTGPMGAWLWGAANMEYSLPPDHTMDTLMADRALQTAYAGINRQDFDGQTFIAELGETLNMLRNPFKGLPRMWKKAQNARILSKKLSSFGDISADRYLQYTYGIKPLIGDIGTIYRTFRTLGKEIPLRRASGRDYSEESYSGTISSSCVGLSCTGRVAGTRRRSTTAKVYYTVSERVRDVEWMNKWGFNPLSLPVTAWNLVPCSFVADWFLDVGLWLRAIMPKLGSAVLGNCITEKYVADYTLSLDTARISIATPPAITYDLAPSLHLERHEERIIRIVNQSLNYAPLRAGGLDNLQKVVSSIMLLWQRVPHPKR